MIAFLDGKIVRMNPSGVLELAVGSVGFEIQTPASYESAWSPGDEVHIFTHLVLSNEKPTLYGFATSGERDLFRLLLTATQVGPRMGISLLELGALTIARAIASGDSRTLSAAPGIGAKKSERIILELRDKVGELSLYSTSAELKDAGSVLVMDASQEAVEALVQLGFTHQSALKAVASACEDSDENIDTAGLIKLALRFVRGA
ncbi:Holliday junction branch migration protein RuvA [bacterium]|nr:Holliday junction branch migration protein RuvA [bacterium]